MGAWVWATKPLNINALTFYDGQQFHSQRLQIDTTPQFYAIPVVLSENASRMRMVLLPGVRTNGEKWTVFFDGLVMVEGTLPLDEEPQFNDLSAQQGMWGGQAFNNLLRNASGEHAGPDIQPWVKELSPSFYKTMSPTLVVGSLLDWRGAGWYYQAAVQNLTHTFWAKFGWGHVPLLPFTEQFYFLLQVITLIGIAGVGIRLLRRGFSQSWDIFLFLGVAFAGILGQTILRGIQSLYGTVFLPGTRYAYPIIVPFTLALNAGWLEIAHFLERWHLPHHLKFWLYALFFLILDMASLWSVFYYYYIR